ncbi:RNA-dependent RNA polymerase [Metarhizium brunneum]
MLDDQASTNSVMDKQSRPDENGQSLVQVPIRLPATCTARQIAYGKLNLDKNDDTLIFAQHGCHDAAAGIEFAHDAITISVAELDRISIPNRTVGHIFVDRSKFALTMALHEPPRFYSRHDVACNWYRRAVMRNSPYYRTYSIRFEADMFDRAVNALEPRRSFRMLHQLLPTQHEHSGSNDASSLVEDLELRLHNLHCQESMIPFTLLFQAVALARSGHLDPATGCDIIDEARHLLHHAEPNVPAVTQLFRRRLFQAASESSLDASRRGHNVSRRPENSASSRVTERHLLEQQAHDSRSPASGRALVLKALVTPTRIVLRGPDLETKNRVLRMFPGKPDHFLRVTFGDEDGEDLSYGDRTCNDDIFEHYRRILLRGLTVAGRRFEFLAFSHSSLRSHSAWFCSPFVGQSLTVQDCRSIVKSLGVFQNIRIPAKCAARIGQAFSETPIALSLSQRGIRLQYIDDVKNSAGTRVFSDGVGTISMDALQEVWDCLPERLGRPTCIQIRIAGVKGMLSLDSRLRGKYICIRSESMMKFKSQDVDVLGICDVGSRPLRFTLNRQIVKILEDMGIHHNWFLAWQDKAIRNFLSVASSTRHTRAFLRQYEVGTSLRLPELLEKLEENGIDYREDDFLRSVVGQAILGELRFLKYKARIPVSKAVTLFGVMDETGFLQEGQIYVTYDVAGHPGATGIEAVPAKGRALVTRSPALHPGDIQYVEMVTPPFGHALLELRNCIVFSSQGSRDLPSMLSGGDLDGDLYSVIWDSDAVPTRNLKPAEYPRISPKPYKRQVRQEDMANFFIDFMKNDVLGIIATRHQMYADLKPAGTLDPECIRLAEMHSAAVDYSKSGVPVEAHFIPKVPQARADFLVPAPTLSLHLAHDASYFERLTTCISESETSPAQPGFATYQSNKILGRLFREIDEHRIWKESTQAEVTARTSGGIWDGLLKHVESDLSAVNIILDWETKLATAKNLRTEYDMALAETLRQFSVNPKGQVSEVEAFSGRSLNSAGRQSRRHRVYSAKLADRMEELTAWMSGRIRECSALELAEPSIFVNEQGDELRQQQQRLVELCRACVAVGGTGSMYGPAEDVGQPVGLESFRVLAAGILLSEVQKLLW